MKHDNFVLTKVVAVVMLLSFGMLIAISITLFESDGACSILLTMALVCVGAVFSICPALMEKSVEHKEK